MAEKPTLNTVNPDLYSIYQPRDSASRIQWGQIGKDLQKTFDGIEEEKANKKKKLDEESNALFTKVAEIELNADKTFSDSVLEMASNLKKNLLMQQKLMKDGRIPPEKFRQLMQKAKDQMSQFGIMAKSAQEYTDNAVKRQQDNSASASETYLQESNQGFNNLNGTVNWMDPGTNTAYIVRLDENGNMPSYKDSPESYLPASYANNRSKYQYDRSNADIVEQTATYKDQMMQLITSFPLTTEVNGMEGVYNVSIEDVRRNKDRFDEMKNQLFESKFNYDDEVLSNAAAQMDGQFAFAQSEEEFKKNNPGKDLKYWIQVDANSYPPKFIPNDREFMEKTVRGFSDTAFDNQMDKITKISGGVSFPQANSATIAQNESVNEGIGYLQRVNDIIAGDMSDYLSASAAGIQQLNAGKNNPDEMIDSIKRIGDQIIIEYQSGRREQVNRKDTNGKIRSTKDLSREVFQLVTPGTDSQGKPMSFDDITAEFEKTKQYTINTRNMSDAEIKTNIKNESAKANLIAEMKKKLEAEVLAGTKTQDQVDKELADYQPTPAEIRSAGANIQVTDQQVTDAKANGIPTTYSSEDAIAYSSRTPYTIKGAGDPIIRAQGDKMPTVTGVASLQADTGRTADNLEFYFFSGTGTRKKEMDGAVNKVFKAYMPSSIRKNAKIEVDGKTGNLVVTYKGKKLSLPGVTDIKLNSDLTYVKLDQMLAEAAQDIINKRNTELANRKGGKPSAY